MIDKGLSLPELSIADKLLLSTKKALILYSLNDEKEAKRLLKFIIKIIKSNQEELNFDNVLAYSMLERQIGDFKYLFKAYKVYSPKTDLLFMLHALGNSLTTSEQKSLQKEIESLAKSLN